MKKILILIVAVIASLTVATAQTASNKHHVHRANHRAGHLTEKLGLTAEQKQKVHALSVDFASKVEAAKSKNAEPAKLKKEIKAIRKDFKSQMKTILTVEQYTKWEKLKKESKKKLDNESPDTDELDD